MVYGIGIGYGMTKWQWQWLDNDNDNGIMRRGPTRRRGDLRQWNQGQLRSCTAWLVWCLCGKTCSSTSSLRVRCYLNITWVQSGVLVDARNRVLQHLQVLAGQHSQDAMWHTHTCRRDCSSLGTESCEWARQDWKPLHCRAPSSVDSANANGTEWRMRWRSRIRNRNRWPARRRGGQVGDIDI